MMKTNRYVLKAVLVLLAAMLHTDGRAGIRVSFDAESYEVNPGSDIEVAVVIDGDTTVEGLQPVSGGLFSFGLSIELPEGAEVADIDQPAVVEALDHDGFLAGAGREIVDRTLVSRGNVSIHSSELNHFGGTTLMTLRLRPNLSAGAQLRLGIGSASSDAAEAFFVDGGGTPFDANITFAGAVIQVVEKAPDSVLEADIRLLPSGRIEITFDPIAGKNHFVQSSSNLASWYNVASTPQNSGRFEQIRTVRSRFFRVVARDG